MEAIEKLTKSAPKQTAEMLQAYGLGYRLVAALLGQKQIRNSLQGPGPDLITKVINAQIQNFVADPVGRLIAGAEFWQKSLQNAAAGNPYLAALGEQTTQKPPPHDKRFQAEEWTTNPYFGVLRQQYLLFENAVDETLASMDILENRDQHRAAFFARQIVELLNPANFYGSNPEAQTRAAETDGQSLIKGLEHLLEDLEASDGRLLVKLADEDAFTVGEDLATTPGKILFQNDLFELIQYAPTTEKVQKTPLIIFPPWINKFYILDLKPQNSLIKWCVDQGHTVFVVSWVNPDKSHADVGLDTYVSDGFLAAIDQVKSITGEKQVNAVGYCIAGTTLSMTLALLAKRGDKSVKSATFFTTLTDFSDQGEFTPFLDDDFVDGIVEEATENDVLDKYFMARTFSYLRSRDLVYAPAIKRYMLGEAPPAFDLLYWNGDSTNLAGRMCIEYLRWLCQENRFAEGRMDLLGDRLSLVDVTVPVCAIACEADHIAAWKTSYQGIRRMKSRSKTFIVSESGHIAGIVNPPTKQNMATTQMPTLHPTRKPG